MLLKSTRYEHNIYRYFCIFGYRYQYDVTIKIHLATLRVKVVPGLRWLETVLFGARRLGSNLPLRLKKWRRTFVWISYFAPVFWKLREGKAQLLGSVRKNWKRLELRWQFTWIMCSSLLSTRSSTQPHMKRESLYSEAVQLNCAREDGDFKTLLSSVKSYKGPGIVVFLPSFFHWLF